MAEFFDKHAENYSEEIDEYLDKYGATHDFFTTHKAWLIEDLLARHGVQLEDTRVLDVGCGVGKIHTHLTSRCRDITGVDVSDASLEVARKIYPDNTYLYYDGHVLPAEDASFDLSLAICVFHHVPPGQWADLATEMLRVLRPGGVSLVIEHNPYNLVTRRIVNTCPLDEDAVLLRPGQLKELFRQAGGKNVRSRTVLSVPPKYDLLKRIDGYLGVLPFGAQYYVMSRKREDAAS